MRKERFPTRRQSKLQPRGDGPFQVLERVNDNAYKLDLPGEYNISATFNVADLSPFDAGTDSRSNPFEERGNDDDHGGPNADQGGQLVQDPLKLPSGPITRSKFIKIQEGFIGLIQKFLLAQEKAQNGTTILAQAHSVTTQVQAHPIGATLTQFPLWHVSQVNTNYLEADSAH